MENINQRVFKLLGRERGVLSCFAKFLSVSDSSVSSWKNRGSEIPAKYIPKIAEFLNVSVDYLLTGKEEGSNGNFFSEDEIASLRYLR
jgi:transcriptional regulator with XRE-family HTH domain